MTVEEYLRTSFEDGDREFLDGEVVERNWGDLSPEDRIVRMQPKVQEYLSIGTDSVWLIDAELREALCYSQENRGGIACDVLRTENPVVKIPVRTLFRKAFRGEQL